MMDELIYTKGVKKIINEEVELQEPEEDVKKLIAEAILGALVGVMLVIAFNLSYNFTYHMAEYLDRTQSNWCLQLVNSAYTVPDSHEIELVSLKNGQSVDHRIYEDLQDMMDDARAAGFTPLICSSYRSHEEQIRLFNKEISKYVAQGYSKDEAIDKAAQWVAIPGTSEHELGLALDIVAQSNQILDISQAQTPEQQWLMANSYKYGFVLRYPADKSELTGIGYEPWHYRYVGKEAAKIMIEQELCLEEYLQ